MLHLVQTIANEGGSVIAKATLSDIFVKYDIILDDGTLKEDSRYNYVYKDNQDGANIEIITFDELLSRLNITEEELNAKELLPLEILIMENTEIKSKKDNELINHKSQNKRIQTDGFETTIGEIAKSKGINLEELITIKD